MQCAVLSAQVPATAYRPPPTFFLLLVTFPSLLATNSSKSFKQVSKPATSEEQQFLALLEAHQNIVHKVCRMYARSEEARRDLFQDIVAQMWRAWPAFRQDCKVSTWMYRIALNVAIAGQRKQELPTAELTDTQHLVPAGEQEMPDAHARLYAALERLSLSEKSLALLYLEDHTYEEMAQITGLSADNLRVRMFRIREKLKMILRI